MIGWLVMALLGALDASQGQGSQGPSPGINPGAFISNPNLTMLSNNSQGPLYNGPPQTAPIITQFNNSSQFQSLQQGQGPGVTYIRNPTFPNLPSTPVGNLGGNSGTAAVLAQLMSGQAAQSAAIQSAYSSVQVAGGITAAQALNNATGANYLPGTTGGKKGGTMPS